MEIDKFSVEFVLEMWSETAKPEGRGGDSVRMSGVLFPRY